MDERRTDDVGQAAKWKVVEEDFGTSGSFGKNDGDMKVGPINR